MRRRSSGSGRVTKFAQRFTEKLNLGRRETAILCVLMLRGQQTVGEIKGRTERMYAFADLDETETVLQKMMDRAEGALVQKLPHAPGTKEPRYAQTLGGAVDVSAAAVAAPRRCRWYGRPGFRARSRSCAAARGSY